MLKGAYNHLRGSVQIDLRGAAIERFLNLCTIHDIPFWQVRCLDADHFTAWVSTGGYFALRHYARNTGCRVRILRKKGTPFLLHKFTRRLVLCIGLALCLIAIWFLSGRVWTIEVRGCQQTTPEEILALLKTVGIYTGTKRSDLDIRNIQNTVMINSEKLSYFTVNFQGTHAVVEVWEKRNQQKKPELPEPCNVISDKTGIITELRVRTGTALVKVGDTLQPGDLIATGVIVNENDETQVTLLHAQAEADVRTWKTLRTLVPKELQTLTQTPVQQTTTCLQLGSRRFPALHIEKNGFSWYDKQVEKRYLRLREDFRWPVGLTREKIYSCSLETPEIDEHKLEAVLEERMILSLMEQHPEAKILHTQFTLEKEKNGAWMGILKAELLETCGVEVPIE